MLWTILAIFILILIAALIWLTLQPAEFEVSRTRVINAPIDKAYNSIRDLTTWEQWSPWVMHEPETKITYAATVSEEGSWYEWDGKFIGAGRLQHESLSTNRKIKQKIRFTRPMQSESDVYWTFEEDAQGTKVTWGMKGRMPFFFRWMNAKMDTWVGNDYSIGLALLAGYLGDEENPVAFKFHNVVTQPAIHYMYESYAGTIDDMPAAMREGFSKLMAAVEHQGLEMEGDPFSVYNKFKLKKNYVECHMGIPLKASARVDGFPVADLPEQKYSRTEMQGSYDYFELAWHSAFSHIRMFKQKFEWRKPFLERYLTSPDEASGLELRSYLDIPVK